MKRFHVHIAVNNLAGNITFYSKLFGQAPDKEKPDYAKWMLEDPPLSFALSSRGHAIGINHFGIQADSTEELSELRALADSASGFSAVDQGDTACCYARSEKHWTFDPQGIAWEHFYTMADLETFTKSTAPQKEACCIPLSATGDSADGHVDCCLPNEAGTGEAECCRRGLP
ncbi:ArsI/CadI family heavy metal resistance metalloenzyme [Microbulbifer sp. M83]|uniref:ArsI/CadI family heavy metal resistance metalloenzyme n=1 Tax=Microbulbifer sp. M83 TaxID=3118246 RepID=UPI002FE3A77A